MVRIIIEQLMFVFLVLLRGSSDCLGGSAEVVDVVLLLIIECSVSIAPLNLVGFEVAYSFNESFLRFHFDGIYLCDFLLK